jgi:hypothetical protein
MVRRYVTGLGTIVAQFAFALVAHDFGHPRKDHHEKLLAATLGLFDPYDHMSDEQIMARLRVIQEQTGPLLMAGLTKQ